jgi:anti-anti-sigma factor
VIADRDTHAGEVRTERVSPSKVVVVLEGDQDLSTAASLEATLTDLMSKNRLVVVDVSRVQFMDSLMLDVIFRAHAHAPRGCRFRVQVAPGDLMYRVFEIVSFIEEMDVVSTRDEAITM